MPWAALLIQAASVAGAPLSFTALPRCEPAGSSEEVVVCARRRDGDRLPLRDERGTVAEPARGGSGLAALTPPGRCGIFEGERRCGNRERAGYGYGRGRDPVSVVARLAGKVADPDGD